LLLRFGVGIIEGTRASDHRVGKIRSVLEDNCRLTDFSTSYMGLHKERCDWT
jgi:hypothetical protein